MGVLKAKVGGSWVEIPGAGGPGVQVTERGTYTPTLTNIVVGVGGINTAAYTYVGGPAPGDFGLMTLDGNIVLGSSGFSVGAASTSITLPPGFQAVYSSGGPYLPAAVRMADLSAGTRFDGGMQLATSPSAVITFQVLSVSGTLMARVAISSTAPFTWATTDVLNYYLSGLAVQRI